ncbi:MAG: DUF2264 domain-containing protein [Hungatella sp.]
MFDKQKFQTMLLDMVEPLKSHYSEGKAELDLGATAAAYGPRIAKMEGFSRVLWGMVPYWAGGGLDESLIPIYLEGFRNGTDPNSSEYWGDLHNKDQRMVEMAAIAYAILLIPDKLWEPLSEETKDHMAAWLGQINLYTLAENNWQYFNVITNLALKSVHKPYSQERMKEAMDNYESFYLGNGWYSDGLRPQKDYYISFAIHYYCLLYSKFMAEEDPERSHLFEERAQQFAQTFLYWFDEEGKALPYGRSQTYRFAQGAFWSVCAMVGVDCFEIGILKGLIERHLDYWLKQPIFDNGHVLTVGYGYPNLLMSEGYNATGSPYWSFKVFAFLALPDDHEFWKIPAQPLPQLKPTQAIPECNMLMQHRPGDVTALTAGQYPTMEHTYAAEKYAKFAYSSQFGFSVPRSYYLLSEAGTDSMLTIYAHGMYYVRRKCLEFQVTDTNVYAKWSPVEGVMIETWLTPTERGHRRRHVIESTMACVAYDCGFSYPNMIDGTKIREEPGCAAIWDAQGKSTALAAGGEGMVIRCLPNLNLLYPNTYIPAIRYEIMPGKQEFMTDLEAEKH